MKIIYIILVIAALALIGFGIFRQQTAQSLGGIRFANETVANSSSSLTVGNGGAVLWAAASSSGIWFRITNTGLANVYCAPAVSTSSIGSIPSGVHLGSVASSSVVNFWEGKDIGGPISCRSDATTTVVYSYAIN